jgi:hypothetical protein
VIRLPRGYSGQVSMDGTTWSTPVAEAKGDGARPPVMFVPTRATFMRITHTDTVSGAPPWSIRSVRVSDSARHQGGN